MTADERAREIVEEHCDVPLKDETGDLFVLAIADAIRADREDCAKALDTIAASSPPGSEPLGFHAGVRHACAGGAAAIRGRK